jgi:small subunit ribosomal protein S17
MAEEEEKAVEETAEAPAEAEASAAADPSSEPHASSSEAPAAADAPKAAEPEPVLPPKERRAAARAAKAAKVPVRAATTPEERQAERDEVRSKKAASRRAGRVQARAKYKASEHERQPTPAREHVAGIQKVRQGIVVSDKADKTITVRIDVARRHRRYQKIVRTSSTVHAHDERNDAHTGDTVVVRESRPLSRTKRWRLVEVVERAK